MMKFNHLCRNVDGEWIDDYFTDESRNSILREWLLATNMNTGEKYAMLLRAEGPEDGFEMSVKLPRKFIKILESSTPKIYKDNRP